MAEFGRCYLLTSYPGILQAPLPSWRCYPNLPIR